MSNDVSIVMAAETMTVPVFRYSCQEVPVACAKSHEKNSEFDKLLWSQWDNAMTSGSVFRYSLSDVSTRRLPGRYGFIVQRNIKRNTHRRSPAEMTAVRQPFDPGKFNFNKINKREVLLEIRRQCKNNSTNIDEELYLIIANVSPINYGHVLLVPSPEKCLPQVFTEQSLLTCLELVALSTHRGFCMVGNSTLAYASVNHLHYHFLYLEPPLMAVTLMGRHLVANCYELHEHPIPSIGFYISLTEEGKTVSSSSDSATSSDTVSSALRHCAKQLYTAIAVLLDEEIPHNLCAIRGPPFIASSSTKDCTGIRVLLVPRAPALGYKKVCETEDGIPLLNPAAMELSGFIQIIDQTRYDTVTESEIVEALRQKALTTETFERLKRKIIPALQEL